ncbi:MAG: hypothetical protein ACOC0N_11280 [Chroococcales cyanobacterium]
MSFNPLKERGIALDDQLRNWSELNVQPYRSEDVHPYTRTRVITLNGIEVESVFFSHQFARHTADPEIRKYLAMTRRIEQQQQKAVNWLIPGNESTLEVTIGYEQVAVDLTAYLARTEPDPYLKQAFEFGLLEDFDHLYRYANLLDMMDGKKAERIVGEYTEIIPGRPTIAEHRNPVDDVRKPSDSKKANPLSMMHVLTLVAAEQQTMNFYMTVGNRPMEPLARGLYLEIGQIEEQHVTHYESLLDPTTSWFEQEVLHQYNECYLYYSFMQQETDPRIKQIWELHLNMELEHLRLACEMLRKYENRDPESFLPKELPEPIRFEENKDYIRQVLNSQVNLTGNETEFVPMNELPQDHRYFQYQDKVNGDGVPSEQVIEAHMREKGTDYRLETGGERPLVAH